MASGTKITKASPTKWVAAAVAVVGLLNSMSQQRKAEKRHKEMQALFEKRMAAYEKLEYTPINIEDFKQENIFEDKDLTSDVLQAADLATLNFQRSQMNILDIMQRSGTAQSTIATQLSGAGQDFSQRLQQSVSGDLQKRNMLALQEAKRIQDFETRLRLSNVEGERQFAYDKMATLMGVAGQRVSGATQSLNYANQGVSAAYGTAATALDASWQTQMQIDNPDVDLG